ncbi:hypothetical protein SeMB42_g00300 [Synchytrium endobioticum]|uniref:Uncharacterized protein n=1 Tax=Synchytrium endobioticum TaxID=286115 RepID=A0A507DS92_9FUNG|nr:hypothetical protein SeMB42_g00300 [Synchytrium endobioticum]
MGHNPDDAAADHEMVILERARHRVQERRERRIESMMSPTFSDAALGVSPRSVNRASSPSLIPTDNEPWPTLTSAPASPPRATTKSVILDALLEAPCRPPVSPSRYHRRGLSRGMPLDELLPSPGQSSKLRQPSNIRVNESIANLVSRAEAPRRQAYKRSRYHGSVIDTDVPRPSPSTPTPPSVGLAVKSTSIIETTEPVSVEDRIKTEEEEIMKIAQLALMNLPRNFIELRKWHCVSSTLPKGRIFFPSQLAFKPGSDTWTTIYEGLRFPEEEGLYVAPAPNASWHNIQRIERRLRGTEPNYARDWYDPPHRMLINAPVLIAQPPRPFPILKGLPQDSNSELVVEVRPKWPQSLHPSIESGSYLLVLELASVRFDDHPLMNDEIRAARELDSVWRVLRARKREEVVEFCQRKVEALHAAYEQYKLENLYDRLDVADGVHAARPASAESIKSPSSGYAQRLLANRAKAEKERRRYEIRNKTTEMRQDLKIARLLRDTESQTSRLLEFKILKLWQELQHLRTQQGYSTSPLKLTVKVMEADVDADIAEIEQDIREEVEELRDEFEAEQEERLRLWSIAYKEWEALEKERQSLLAEQGIDPSTITRPRTHTVDVPTKNPNETKEERRARKKAKKVAKSANKKAESGAVSPAKSVTLLLENHPVPLKPKRGTFSECKIRAQVLKRLESSRRPVGAPVISLQVSTTHQVTASASLPRAELARRTAALSTQFHLRLYYNDKEVARTVSKPIHPDTFEFSGGVWEETKASRSRARNNGNTKKDKQVNPVSGMTVGLLVKEEPEKLRLTMFESGTLGDTFVCELLPPLPPPAQTALSRGRAKSELPFSGRPYKLHINMRTKPDLAPAAGPEVEDRRTKGVLSIGLCWGVGLNGQSLGPSQSSRYRRLWAREHEDHSHQLAPLRALLPMPSLNGQGPMRQITDWIGNARLDPNDPRNAELLQFRDLVQMGNNGPWKDRKVFRFTISQKLIESALGVGFNLETETKRNALLIARSANAVAVRGPVPFIDNEILESQWDRIPFAEKTPEVKHAIDYLIKDTPTYDVTNQLSLLKRIRVCKGNQFLCSSAYNPTLLVIAVQTPSASETVARALNVPVRSRSGQTPANTELITVKPFVEISFQSRRVRTECSEGPNPIWDETLSLDVTVPHNGFRPDMLMESDIASELIWFHLFDEVTVDLIEDERDRNEFSHLRTERNWLGCFSLPFATVYEQVRVEGSFCVRVPPATIGYERSSLIAPDAAVMVGVDPPQETLLHIFMVLDPPLAELGPLNLIAHSDDSDKILKHAEQWSKGFAHLRRRVMATAITLAGKSALLPHFLRPNQPPNHLMSPSALLAWTSSIPYLHFRAAVGSSTELWSSAAQVVEMGCADQAEHALWLCSFLLGTGRESYMVLGSGPGHSTGWWVAVREDEWGPGVAVNEGGQVQATPAPASSGVTPQSYPVCPTPSQQVLLPMYPQYAAMPGDFPVQQQTVTGPSWSLPQQQYPAPYWPPWAGQSPYPTSPPIAGVPLSQSPPRSPIMRQQQLLMAYPYLPPMSPQAAYPRSGPLSPQIPSAFYPMYGASPYPFMQQQHQARSTNPLNSMRNALKSVLSTSITPRAQPAFFGFGADNPDFRDRKHAWRIIDAVAGETFSVRDAHCPLKHVGCVFNHENIWANIQQSDDPRRISWDTTEHKYWSPFFTKSFPRPESFDTMQPEAPPLHIRPLAELREIQVNLEKVLVSSIETWRGRRYTRWNRLCSRTFEAMLSRFEDDVAAGLGPSLGNNSPDLSRDWKALTSVYSIRGFPMRLAYADINSVVAAVQATDVHSAGDPRK